MRDDAAAELKLLRSADLVREFDERENQHEYQSSLNTSERIAVIGLGYVGFPLSMDLADRYKSVVGFDVSANRVSKLKVGVDSTGEIAADRIKSSPLIVSDQMEELAKATFYIVTVPTPIDDSNRPDLGPVRSACELVSLHLSKGDIVVFESTVYPGVTEDICAPILEAASGLKSGHDFNVGYSPERISPGDKEYALRDIVKNVSADTSKALERVTNVYESIIDAGVYQCASIKVAEAAKIIENTQRDVNIALMNELAMICDRIDLNTHEVIEAASTKWNFLKFYPGLVGGHCIGVDPYYLASLSETVGHYPELVLASRRVNESMAGHVVSNTIKRLVRKGGAIQNARVGVFGLSFKENVPDIRNSKSLDIARELQAYGINVLFHDPLVDADDAAAEGLELTPLELMKDLDVVVMTVAHNVYIEDPSFLQCLRPDGIFMDVKSAFCASNVSSEQEYWSL